MVTNNAEGSAWLVVAEICDCCRNVKTEIVGGKFIRGGDANIYLSDQYAQNDNKIVRAGNDWRPLVVDAATEMQRRTRRPISPGCTTILVNDYDFHSIAEEAVDILFALTDRRGQDLRQ